jgi:hypothetical protein
MDTVSSAAASASSATTGSVQGAASISVMKQAMNLQATTAAQLLASVQQPVLASSGTLGTRVNAYV